MAELSNMDDLSALALLLPPPYPVSFRRGGQNESIVTNPLIKPADAPYIDNMPSEILNKILLFVIEAEKGNTSSRRDDRGHKKRASFSRRYEKTESELPTIIRMTRICRRWRTFALDYSLFWTHIDTGKFPYDKIEAYLDRSGSALLTVRMGFGDDEKIGHTTPGTVELLQRQSHRIRSWEIVTDKSEAVIESGLSLLATPVLDTLILDIDCDYTEERERYVVLSSQVFPANIQPLRSLSLSKKSFPVVNDSWFRSLKSLTISDMEIHSLLLFQVLRSCSELEKLHLSEISGLGVHNPEHRLLPIPLPHLKEICLHENQGCCTSILQYLDLPEHFLWDIKCYAHTGSNLIHPSLAAATDCGEMTIRLSSQLVDVNSKCSVSVSCMHTSNLVHLVWPLEQLDQPTPPVDSALQLMASKMIRETFFGVTELHLIVDHAALERKEDWAKTLQEMHDLRSLKLTITPGGQDEACKLQNNIVGTLRPLLENFRTGNKPRLQVLELNDFRFDEEAAEFISAFTDVLLSNVKLEDGLVLRLKSCLHLKQSMLDEWSRVIKVQFLNVITDKRRLGYYYRTSHGSRIGLNPLGFVL